MPQSSPPNLDDTDTAIYLGIDVGGTNVKLGLVDSSGRLRAKTSVETPPLKTPDRVFRYAIDYTLAMIGRWQLPAESLRAVGLAVPGVLDSREFVLREVVNLPGWLGEPLAKILETVCQRPAIVLNDANAAAFAEHSIRNLGNQSLAMMTLGTGIGCGIVVAGSPYGGDHGCAGELGHIAVDFGDDALPCTCGSRGHLETYAGASGITARLQAALCGDDDFDASRWTPRDIAEAAERGDLVCQTVIDETAQYIGRAIGMMGQTLDPAVVLLGGAMTFGGSETATGRNFLDRVRKTVKETTLVQVGGNMTIEFATLGNDAGFLGAAMLANRLNERDWDNLCYSLV